MRPEDVWYGAGWGPRVARGALAPASWLFAAGAVARGALFDVGVLRARATAVPALAVGNLSVGGTGKTPVAADLARRALAGGGRPAVLLRGYGEDEAAVHAMLNPAIPVVTGADRVAGSRRARALGCDLVVLDDAFQHRWASRVADVVVVAAEQWRAARCLPAGPLREPRSALRRATLVVVTRKVLREDAAVGVAGEVGRYAPAVPVARVLLAPDGVVAVHDGQARLPVSALAGERVVAVAGVGVPTAFAGQLRAAGAAVDLRTFPDHHRYTAADVRELTRRTAGASRVVCTLKDAVKLAALWPRAAQPLWYVSQRVTLEAGDAAYDAVVARLLAARDDHPAP